MNKLCCILHATETKVLWVTGLLKELNVNEKSTRPTCLPWKVLLIFWRYINHSRVKKSNLSTEVKTPFWETNRPIRKFHRLGAKPWRRIVADKVSATRMMDRTGMYMEQSQKLLATWRSSHRTGASRPPPPIPPSPRTFEAFFTRVRSLAILFIGYKEPVPTAILKDIRQK
jgi:hypothetical protein